MQINNRIDHVEIIINGQVFKIESWQYGSNTSKDTRKGFPDMIDADWHLIESAAKKMFGNKFFKRGRPKKAESEKSVHFSCTIPSKLKDAIDLLAEIEGSRGKALISMANKAGVRY